MCATARVESGDPTDCRLIISVAAQASVGIGHLAVTLIEEAIMKGLVLRAEAIPRGQRESKSQLNRR